jgi:hypothetical protein
MMMLTQMLQFSTLQAPLCLGHLFLQGFRSLLELGLLSDSVPSMFKVWSKASTELAKEGPSFAKHNLTQVEKLEKAAYLTNPLPPNSLEQLDNQTPFLHQVDKG